MIFTEQECETLLYAVNVTHAYSGLTAGTYDRLSTVAKKLATMREMERAARVKRVMCNLHDALSVTFGPNPALYPGEALVDAGKDLEMLLEELGGA